jgi:long-chain acyl-CoA synthetase
VEGTKKVMSLARYAQAKGKLERVAHISTAFVSGNRSGTIKEDELDCRQEFSNNYEQTKFEAEMFVRQSCQDLPLVIFRPSIIVGDSRTGATSAFNVLYIPLKYLARGRVRFVPGRAATPLDVVPVDYVCDAICQIFFHTKRATGQTYHLCSGGKKATSVGAVTSLALDYFRQLWPWRTFSGLRFISVKWMTPLRIVEPFLGRSRRKVIRKWRAFVPFLNIQRFFDTSLTEAALQGSEIAVPLFDNYYKSLLRYCLLTNWGEQPAEAPPGNCNPLPQAQGI